MRSFRALYYRHVTVAMLDSAHAHRFFFLLSRGLGFALHYLVFPLALSAASFMG